MKNFVWTVRVYHEDTDDHGVVYYANYLKFMERARTEWLRSQGFEQNDLSSKEKVVFVVRSLTLEYYRPARFNDLLEVWSRASGVRGASLVFEQTIVRAAAPSESLCSGRIKVACVDVDSFRPKPIPKPILTEIASGN